MDGIVVFNGLGNQMSQYAFYLAKKELNPKNTICFFYDSNQHNGFELNRVFGIDLHQTARELKYKKLFNFLYNKNICCKIIRKLLHYLFLVRFYYEDMKTYDYNEKKLKRGKGVINFYMGGWHSYLYCESVHDKLKEIFLFDKNKIHQKNQELANVLEKECSVSIHIRRGDYLTSSIFSNVATMSYYLKALKMIKNKFGNVLKYYLFSDDIEWAREKFNCLDVICVDWNTLENSWQDLYLISKCKININANSTFSWWGAYLNYNSDKIVIVPDRFINSYRSKDFYPSEWIQISGT